MNNLSFIPLLEYMRFYDTEYETHSTGNDGQQMCLSRNTSPSNVTIVTCRY
jgi:hypothetical protein